MKSLIRGRKGRVLGIVISAIFMGLDVGATAAFSNFSEPSDSLLFDVDVVNLAVENSELSRLDLYIRINYDELQFVKVNDQFRARYEVIVNILDKSGKPVDGRDLRQEVLADDIKETDSISKNSLLKMSFELSPQEYRIALSVQDLETQKIANRTKDVALRNYAGTSFQASDILYVDYISKDENGNYTFSPKVSTMKPYGSKLYAYFEVYNISESDSIHVNYDIIKQKSGEAVPNHSSTYWLKSDGRVTKNCIEIAGETLPPGHYATRVQLAHHQDTLTVQRAFEWYWEGIPSMFSNLNEAVDALAYIAGEKELKKLKLTPESERHAEYLKFWEKRDPTPGTAENELRLEYYQRIKFANENFYGYKKSGWRTDMGWAYVKLGSPDNIERDPFNQKYANFAGRTIKAFEVWEYYRYNRQLVFIDENGFGEYRLDNPDALYDIIR